MDIGIKFYRYAELKSDVLKFWRPGPKGPKMVVKMVEVL